MKYHVGEMGEHCQVCGHHLIGLGVLGRPCPGKRCAAKGCTEHCGDTGILDDDGKKEWCSLGCLRQSKVEAELTKLTAVNAALREANTRLRGIIDMLLEES